MKKYHPAPWISGKDKEQCPTYIWYWMREGEYGPPRSCMEIKTRSIGKEGVSGFVFIVIIYLVYYSIVLYTVCNTNTATFFK